MGNADIRKADVGGGEPKVKEEEKEVKIKIYKRSDVSTFPHLISTE